MMRSPRRKTIVSSLAYFERYSDTVRHGRTLSKLYLDHGALKRLFFCWVPSWLLLFFSSSAVPVSLLLTVVCSLLPFSRSESPAAGRDFGGVVLRVVAVVEGEELTTMADGLVLPLAWPLMACDLRLLLLLLFVEVSRRPVRRLEARAMLLRTSHWRRLATT